MALCKKLSVHNVIQTYRLCASYNETLLKILTPTHKLPQRYLFWERDRKGGYDTKEKISPIQHLKHGVQEIKEEFKLLTQEVKETLKADPLLIARPGEFYYNYIIIKKAFLLQI